MSLGHPCIPAWELFTRAWEAPTAVVGFSVATPAAK